MGGERNKRYYVGEFKIIKVVGQAKKEEIPQPINSTMLGQRYKIYSWPASGPLSKKYCV